MLDPVPLGVEPHRRPHPCREQEGNEELRVRERPHRATVAGMPVRPVIWRPRYATRRMRERAWAKADLERERAAAASRPRRSWLQRLLRR